MAEEKKNQATTTKGEKREKRVNYVFVRFDDVTLLVHRNKNRELFVSRIEQKKTIKRKQVAIEEKETKK